MEANNTQQTDGDGPVRHASIRAEQQVGVMSVKVEENRKTAKRFGFRIHLGLGPRGPTEGGVDIGGHLERLLGVGS